MQFDFDSMTGLERFEFLTGTIVPRPIALITTIDAHGRLNAAPYSFFNIVGHDPAVVAVGVLPHSEGRLKDTGLNILDTQEFVVNLVSEELAEAMNTTCIDAPPGFDELSLTDLKTAPSTHVRPARILSAPAAFECRVHSSISLGPNQAIVIGRILTAHIDDRFVADFEKRSIDTPAMKLIGGMHGAKWYTRTSDQFGMDRPTWAARQKKGTPA